MKHINLNLGLAFVLGLVLMSGIVDLDNLFNYSDSGIPESIDLGIDSSPDDNQMEDDIATLGRVLFYDKKLSSDNTVSCASCHEQEHAFGIAELQGTGVNGLTLRRPMRLLNLRIFDTSFSGVFWDERAEDLEDLASQPIQDHIEMGYSGLGTAPDINDLLVELESVDYYDELFTFVFGDNTITEDRISKALAQFLRSIESYDSRFDTGYAMVDGGPFAENILMDFPNYTAAENLGKMLFNTDAIRNAAGARIGGGLGCFHCHSAPSFTFSSELNNNGVITEIDNSEVLDITKSPNLRDLFNPSGALNGPLFHNGQASTFGELLDHYNDVPDNEDLDLRINVNGIPLNIQSEERPHLEAFIRTLTGTDIYTNEKWSDPFDANGDIQIVGGPAGLNEHTLFNDLTLYPNPAEDQLSIEGLRLGVFDAKIYSLPQELLWQGSISNGAAIDISELSPGMYVLSLMDVKTNVLAKRKFIRR